MDHTFHHGRWRRSTIDGEFTKRVWDRVLEYKWSIRPIRCCVVCAGFENPATSRFASVLSHTFSIILLLLKFDVLFRCAGVLLDPLLLSSFLAALRSARAQLLEVVHRPVLHLRHGEDDQPLQVALGGGQELCHHRRCPPFEGNSSSWEILNSVLLDIHSSIPILILIVGVCRWFVL